MQRLEYILCGLFGWPAFAKASACQPQTGLSVPSCLANTRPLQAAGFPLLSLAERIAVKFLLNRSVLVLLVMFCLSFEIYSQGKDSVSSMWNKVPTGEFYKRHSPIDYLTILKNDFKGKYNFNVFYVLNSPDNWIKEEHIGDLMELIYSSDSTKSVVSVLSSYLTNDRFSSIGREAQILVECFRSKKTYPLTLGLSGHQT